MVSSSGHPPGQEVGLVGLVGQEVGDGRRLVEQDVGQHDLVGMAVFMVGRTALMVVVALACLLARCFAAAAMVVLCESVGFAIGDWFAHNSPWRPGTSSWSGAGTPQVGNSAGMLLLVLSATLVTVVTGLLKLPVGWRAGWLAN